MKPIIFTSPMVRAIVQGRKTETRRVCRRRPGTPDTSNRFGQAGDRLWIRESFSTRKDGQAIKIRYPADGANGDPVFVPIDQVEAKYASDRYFTRPGRFMPRWAARLLLAVISVQIEQLQDITDVGAAAEGFANNEAEHHGRPAPITARAAFQAAWDKLNVSRGYGWDADPLVYVIRFRLLQTKGTAK